jgi:two-component system, NarL family, response regulator NreC
VETRVRTQRVLVVDDHAVIRKGIQSILGAWPEWQVSGEAANGEEAVQLTKELKPDLVLMDISMPGMGGLEATRAIRRASPDTKVLLLTLHDSLECVQTALNAGARGYLLKSDTEGELMRALKVVAGNGIYTSPSLDPDHVNRIVVQLGLIV